MEEQANILECRQGELPLFPSPRRGTHIPGGSSCRIYPRNPRKHPKKFQISVFFSISHCGACESQVFSGTLCRPAARDFGLSMRIVALGLLSCYLRKPEIHALIRSPVTHTPPPEMTCIPPVRYLRELDRGTRALPSPVHNRVPVASAILLVLPLLLFLRRTARTTSRRYPTAARRSGIVCG
jgi:hypothetical protein